MVSKDEVLKALENAVDPETGLSVVAMGLIKDVEIKEAGDVKVKMVLTTPFCPFASHIIDEVQKAAKTVAGVRSTDVEIVGYWSEGTR